MAASDLLAQAEKVLRSLKTRTVEVKMPSGGYGGPSGDMAYEETTDRIIREAIPLGGRYVKHTTRTIHETIATVTYEIPADENAR